jgi:diguanylate cyclase (GGDEF)-like protein
VEDAPGKAVNLRQARPPICDDTQVVPPLPVGAPRAADACLVCICPSGPGLGRRYQVGAEPVTIGRESTCSLTLPDGGVSRTHARIERQANGRYHIQDLDSTNGTYVNDARVRAGFLKDGDYVRLGERIFRFLAGGNVEASYHEEIHRLTVLDPLTGLHNRRYLNEHLDREAERARRHDRPLSVLLMDVDHFKAVNDRFGHLTGDATLKTLAGRLATLTRKDELLARYGGEEFALVLPETGLDGAICCAERLRHAIAERPFEFEGLAYPITISVGVGATPGSPATPDHLLREADGRLYEAKRAGRNRVAPAGRAALPDEESGSDSRTVPLNRAGTPVP